MLFLKISCIRSIKEASSVMLSNSDCSRATFVRIGLGLRV